MLSLIKNAIVEFSLHLFKSMQIISMLIFFNARLKRRRRKNAFKNKQLLLVGYSSSERTRIAYFLLTLNTQRNSYGMDRQTDIGIKDGFGYLMLIFKIVQLE